MKTPLATGRVESLCINGRPVESISFNFFGPNNEMHYGPTRMLSGHDGGYISTSGLKKGEWVFNWRSWTGLSSEEMLEIENALGVGIPWGCLLENIVVSGIPNFSKLPPTSRLVFPHRGDQAILAVWGENGPCDHVGKHLARHYGNDTLVTQFIVAAKHKRGVTGIVLAPGLVHLGDELHLYPPVT